MPASTSGESMGGSRGEGEIFSLLRPYLGAFYLFLNNISY